MAKANPFDPAVKAHPFTPLDFHPAEPEPKPKITYDSEPDIAPETKKKSLIDKVRDFLD